MAKRKRRQGPLPATHYASDEARFQAQDLMYDAFEAEGTRRVALAREALALSPDCADAYLLLAEETASSAEEARELLEQGVAAGERALGPEPFEEDVGHFWRLTSSSYEDDAAAALAYTRALAAFRRGGDSAEARRLLGEARELNPHVRAYLSGRKRLPKRLPDYVGFGDDSEAVDYAAGAAALWASVPGALIWLDS